MKIQTFFLSAAFGFAVAMLFQYVFPNAPEFWKTPVKTRAVVFVSPSVSVFDTQLMKKQIFTVKHGEVCYSLENKSSSFAVIDRQDGTALNMFVVCPGKGAGWVRGL